MQRNGLLGIGKGSLEGENNRFQDLLVSAEVALQVQHETISELAVKGERLAEV